MEYRLFVAPWELLFFVILFFGPWVVQFATNIRHEIDLDKAELERATLPVDGRDPEATRPVV